MPELPTPTDGDDRHVPTEHEGTLPPNYYCRRWNPKRSHYCRARAGSGTEHPGTGRCRLHDGGGDKHVKHGRFRRYATITRKSLRQLIEAQAEDARPLDLHEDLGLARALLEDFLTRGQDNREALGEGIKHVERVARIVESIERIRRETAITPKDLDRLMLNMGLVVRQHVADDAVCAKIQDGWLALRV